MLIVVAGLAGAAGFALDTPWAVAAIVVDLALLGVAGYRTRRRRPAVVWHRSGLEPPEQRDTDTYPPPAADTHGALPTLPQPAQPGHTKFKYRTSARSRDLFSATSRIRQRSAAGAVPMAAPPTRSDQDAVLSAWVEKSKQHDQRAQFWWWLAGIAASIPIGVVINLMTG